ncbi:MAG: sulfite exporter TauE/SafE family protein [Armatimonadetes bacterium]|nr:sulfite exporter TauE/SafE family protein [Armatimonadota bacterium]MBS1710412.1 sulfite exporter TauE/SafE family protein [Armatimonadota bacterium]MBX3108950.1 sulfite exporter TauE/SafE family protein [Fimbriimonadaceae bacterium]
MLNASGWAATFAVGFVLGLLGGGGSILIVPVLVYLFLFSAEQSTGLSLLVVGLSTLIGLFASGAFKSVQIKTALTFALPSSLGAFLARKVLLPATPHMVGPLSRDTFLLVLFAALMLVVAYRMVRPEKAGLAGDSKPNGSLTLAELAKTSMIGLFVGMVAGYLGAGGGFLIVPALNQTLGLPMPLAIPTSLAIIAAQSLIGFTGAIGNTHVDWPFSIGLTAVAVAGLVTGTQFKSKVNPAKLKPAFGYFVLVTGVFILVQELVVKKAHTG